jgi:predicted SAM-dependent methyltransferase
VTGFTHTSLSLNQPVTSYSKVQYVVGRLLRNRKFQVRNVTKEYLNVGCGPYPHPDFVNLDWWWRPGVEVCWDLHRPLPFRDSTMRGIFSEHCLPHFPPDEVIRILGEFYRTLKPGGTVRLVVPDAELYIRLYQRRRDGEPVEFPYPSPKYKTPLMYLTRHFSEYGILCAFDAETLSSMLQDAGFRDVQRTDFRGGRDPVLLIDIPSRRVESLYMEAVKPA